MRITQWLERLLDQAPLILLTGVFLWFGSRTPGFLTATNLLNVGMQAAPAGVVAIGMTLVLLTAGVDLSVGSVMFVAAAVAGKLALSGQPLVVVLAAMLGVGLAGGAVNAWLVARAGVAPFVATLALLFVERGFALWLTQTRAMNLPESFLEIGAAKVAGVPLPFAVLLGMAVLAHGFLLRTAAGRQIYAIGHSRAAATKAGIDVELLLTVVYVLSGVCAVAGAVLALGQLGAVTPKFGENYEFKAISAAVLGGTSLFGGRGRVLPGTLFGVLLVQLVENGLVLGNVDPYLYPLATSAVIFAAVLLDSVRDGLRRRSQRRLIFLPTRPS
jgi:ribose transport system permease protein